MEGWIKLYRILLNWEWYRDSNMVHLLIHLILKANHESRRWQGVLIERGQLLTGRKVLSQETGISLQTIRTCLNRLKSTNEITIKSTNKFSIITICKYESYQATKDEVNQQANQRLTNNQPTANQQLTTNKNDKNIKNEKNSLFRQRFFSVLEIFYFKNYKNPVAVTNAFFNHYEGVGWKNSRGLDIENVESVAENWDNKTTEGINCPVPLLIKWRVMYGILRNNTEHFTKFLLIRPAKLENGILTIRGKHKDIESIEADKEVLTVWKNALFMSYGKVKIEYQLDKQIAA
ncbi:hypothetical protein OU798_04480 [Prolixibacteraceae bacterium Z1-6]|uniref:Uncharacterized protein n=1 Tax=Draconibacterium aestuarii TaxID=2998507 RepID=A0A9X3F370_9BACT|nr:hypothetical protein [Prolixibacteraceae bacterium Z1-6]